MQQFGKMFGGDQSGHNGIMQNLIGMVTGGGLSGLLDKFRSAGMEEKAQSWVSSGQQNQQISGQEVRSALGDQELDRIARESGVSSDEAADRLASAIPDTVNELTPDGNVPDQQTLQQRIGSLAGRIPGL